MKKVAFVVLLVAVVVGAVLYLEQPTRGVAPIAWNEATCAHCQMHIGDERFAAQLQTKEGEVHNFDDTGCVFEWIAENEPAIKQVYFHHYREDRWLNYEEVGFVRVDEPTPMGYGLGAVDQAAHAEALSFAEASHAVLTGEIRADQPTDRDHGRSAPANGGGS